MTSTIKYALYDTPVDFARFMVKGFSAQQLSSSKNLSDKVSLVANAIGLADAFGYSCEGTKKIADQCKSFKLVYNAFNCFPSAINSAPVNPTVLNVINYVKGVFANLASVFTLVDKLELPVNAATAKILSGVSAALGILSGSYELVSDTIQNVAGINAAKGREKQLKILSAAWGVLQKITTLAISALGVMTGLLAMVVTVPAVPFVVIPSLAMASTVFGLFNKYVDYYIQNPAATAV